MVEQEITDEEIQRVIDSNNEELYNGLGKRLGYTGMGLSPEDSRKATIFQARAWYEENQQRIKEKVCASKVLKTMVSHEISPSVVRVVMDVISHHLFGFPPVEIAVLILRMGIKKVCQ